MTNVISFFMVLCATGCSTPASSGVTAEFGLSGVAIVRGRAVDSLGTPRAGLRVGGGVLTPGALYTVFVDSLTNAEGWFSARVEERGSSFRSDSVELLLNAFGGPELRSAEGTSRLWITLGDPEQPAAATALIVVRQ